MNQHFIFQAWWEENKKRRMTTKTAKASVHASSRNVTNVSDSGRKANTNHKQNFERS